MKRKLASDWDNNPLSEDERGIVEGLLRACPNDTCRQTSREAAELLRALQTDFATQLAAIVVIGELPKTVSIPASYSQYELLVDESRRLLTEESKWLPHLHLETDAGKEKAKSHHMVLLTMIRDMRVILILLVRQLIRMRYLKSETEAVQREVSLESQVIYVPLANRLGIGQIKWEMEDAAFRFLHADAYKTIAKAIEERRLDREQYIERVIAELSQLLQDNGIEAEVYGRPKHIYSIWRKMEKKHLDFKQLYDVRALRVIVGSIPACYETISLVHSHWRFIPQEYDDYIAAPKPNRYQSLHTAVYGPDDKVIEIQIRTWDMHENAELGVAAHWRYKEGVQSDDNLDKQIEGWRRLLREENEEESASRVSMLSDSIYVLTPQGHVIEMERGATPLDFAYHIHSNLGHRCRGAKVNGQMVPLTTALKSGQQVEVVTVKEGAPSRDWLSASSGYLQTSRARSKVRQWFKQQFRMEDIERGKTALSKELSAQALIDPNLTALAARFNLKTLDDFFAAIGRGELGPKQVANALQEYKRPVTDTFIPPEVKATAHKPPAKSTVITAGVSDLLTHFARCCKPVPGDPIVGFITKGRGVSIHREACPNAKRLLNSNAERFIAVSWGERKLERFEVDIAIDAMDRPGLLRDVTSVLTAEEINVLAANTHTNKRTYEAAMRLTVELHNMEQLQRALARISQLKGVLTARRST